MRFCVLKVICFVFLLPALSFASKSVDENANLQGENVDVNSIISDLQSGKRGVFAIGNVGSQLTLLISGSGSTTNPSGGYQVAGSESNGVFKITGTPVAVPSGIPSDAITFVCQDSSSNLVAMSSTSVGVLSLPSGSYEPIKVQSDITECYKSDHHYLTSIESLSYFVIDSKGHALKYHFVSKTGIKSSIGCGIVDTFGYVCVAGNSISTKEKCDGTVLSGITSGFVGSKVYLFDSSNTVYSFEGSAFAKDGSPTKLTKLKKEEAFKGESDPFTSHGHLPTEAPPGLTVGEIICVIVLVIIAIIVAVVCIAFCIDPKYEKIRAWMSKKDTKNSKHSGIKSLDSRKSSSKKRHKRGRGRGGSSSRKSQKSGSNKSGSKRKNSSRKQASKSNQHTGKTSSASRTAAAKTNRKGKEGKTHSHNSHKASSNVLPAFATTPTPRPKTINPKRNSHHVRSASRGKQNSATNRNNPLPNLKLPATLPVEAQQPAPPAPPVKTQQPAPQPPQGNSASPRKHKKPMSTLVNVHKTTSDEAIHRPIKSR